METETNLDGEDEETEERMDDLKNDNLQALEKPGGQKAFNSKQSNLTFSFVNHFLFFMVNMWGVLEAFWWYEIGYY